MSFLLVKKNNKACFPGQFNVLTKKKKKEVLLAYVSFSCNVQIFFFLYRNSRSRHIAFQKKNKQKQRAVKAAKNAVGTLGADGAGGEEKKSVGDYCQEERWLSGCFFCPRRLPARVRTHKR